MLTLMGVGMGEREQKKRRHGHAATGATPRDVCNRDEGRRVDA